MMSVSTLISRLTGFMRTWAMGYALGLTVLADSYDIANNLPNMLFELLAGGVLSSVFIPLFMERMKKDGEARRVEVRELRAQHHRACSGRHRARRHALAAIRSCAHRR